MQLPPSILDGELPVDGRALFVAYGLPGGDFGEEGVAIPLEELPEQIPVILLEQLVRDPVELER